MTLSNNSDDSISINTPNFNPQHLLILYNDRQFDKLSEKFIEILSHFESNTYVAFSPSSQYFVNAFVKNFLYLFTQPDYILSDQYILRFIQLNPLISNLVAISSFKNTDAFLDILLAQEKNFAKLLTLYSPRNTVKIDTKIIFDTHLDYACLWYSYYLDIYRTALCNPTVYQNLKDHIIYKDERLMQFSNIADVFFGSTYIDGVRDKELKQQVNLAIQSSPFAHQVIINKPNPKKVAIITCLWYPKHSVYRTLAQFVESLVDDYELTLFCLGEPSPELDRRFFKEVKPLTVKDGQLDISPIQDNDFQLIYYPDVGMSTESILLANLRLAPIQCCGVGHSVSTFGSKIDYYISGADVELVESFWDNYSERLVLLPGYGLINNKPDYQLRNILKQRSEIIVNCSWFSHKINYAMIGLMNQILKNCHRQVLFRFFVGGVESVLRKNGFIPFVKDMEALLPANSFEIVPGRSYEEYMMLMEEGDFSLEAYHFGGCNTVVDSLYLRQPIIAFEGKKWYNRIGSQLLRSTGLSELITDNPQDFASLTLRLIHDDVYRKNLRQKISTVNLETSIFQTESRHSFKKAIDYLITNHDRLQRDKVKNPIFIR